jgi:glycosyltransferase involved in cell wall biosynthesis
VTALVVLPTYNESADVLPMIEALLETGTAPDICVVDDSSPDGTSDVVAAAIAQRPGWGERVRLITRPGKGGRGGAVREGLRVGLENDAYDLFIEMDCDFSHRPEDLVVGAALLSRGWDVVIGARYPDGRIIGWPLQRRVFSRFANTVARGLIDWSVPDYTNGFRFYNRAAVEAILSVPQRNTGYIYLSEALAVCLSAGHTVASFPIVFRNRERGESNTTMGEVVAAARGIIDVARWYRSHR